jgi:hypothetical protein
MSLLSEIGSTAWALDQFWIDSFEFAYGCDAFSCGRRGQEQREAETQGPLNTFPICGLAK